MARPGKPGPGSGSGRKRPPPEPRKRVSALRVTILRAGSVAAVRPHTQQPLRWSGGIRRKRRTPPPSALPSATRVGQETVLAARRADARRRARNPQPGRPRPLRAVAPPKIALRADRVPRSFLHSIHGFASALHGASASAADRKTLTLDRGSISSGLASRAARLKDRKTFRNRRSACAQAPVSNPSKSGTLTPRKLFRPAQAPAPAASLTRTALAAGTGHAPAIQREPHTRRPP